MRDYLKHYIDGRWESPATSATMDVINPASGAIAGRIGLGNAADVNSAVAAAKRSFASYSRVSVAERLGLLRQIVRVYERRQSEVADAITEEMGAPTWLARDLQAPIGLWHLQTAIGVLEKYRFEEQRGATMVGKEPIGVCAFITPWNWPINQIACKVVPALAVGCTMVLKPSEIAPFSAHVWAEILDEAGVPAGVFNLVDGEGPTVGASLSSHPDVDMVSFTGSTRAGIDVARNAAATVKRVHQELGGKSPNLVLEDADMEVAVSGAVKAMMVNSGQSCNAPTRLLVPIDKMQEVKKIAAAAAQSITVGMPESNCSTGPVVSQQQWDKIQFYIREGIKEGATVIAGGVGKPEGLESGYFVKPTIFADVRNDMVIAKEEIFGPVLAIIGYRDEEEAIQLANDTPYGLAAYVQSSDVKHARAVARRLRVGQVTLNYANADLMAPFGGYKQSGNGREWGDHAFAEFLETKAVMGWE